MLLKNSHKNEFNEIEGKAFFPYFHKEITVICREGVSPEYAENCLKYLEQIDEKLILQICEYAEFYLKDIVENTSAAEFHYDNPLALLQYFRFEILYIEEPPASGDNSSEVLNLCGGCDWQEDEGIQCLVKNGEVIYLGGYDDRSVWTDYSKDYICNYVLYESRDELCKMTSEKINDDIFWKTERFARWKSKGFSAAYKLEHFSDVVLADRENVSPKEATRILEDTYLFELMDQYPKLLEESIDFWYECYCIEKEKDLGELVMYINENCY